MYATPAEQGTLVLYSLCVGTATGLIYEVFRFITSFIFFFFINSKKKSSFFALFRFALDILFSLIYTVIAVIFVYGANNGTVRYYILLFAVIGFFSYYYTLGKLFSYIEKKISLLLYNFCIFAHKRMLLLICPLIIFHNSRKIRRFSTKRILKAFR